MARADSMGEYEFSTAHRAALRARLTPRTPFARLIYAMIRRFVESGSLKYVHVELFSPGVGLEYLPSSSSQSISREIMSGSCRHFQMK